MFLQKAVKKAVYLLFVCLISLEINVAIAQDCNLVANGDFASYNEGWKFNSTWPAFADYSVDLKGRAMIQVVRHENGTSDAGFKMIFGQLYLERGQQYSLNFQHEASRDSFPVTVNISDKKGNVVFTAQTLTGHGMNAFNTSFDYQGETKDSFQLELKLPTEKFKYYVDNVSVESIACRSGEARRNTNDPLLLKPKVDNQNSSSSQSTSQTPKAYWKKGYSNIEVSGFARFELLHRHLDNRYTSGIGTAQLRQDALLINGLYPDPSDNSRIGGYQQPFLMLQFDIKPIYNTTLKMDLQLDNQLTGKIVGGDSLRDRRVQMYRYINVQAEHVKNWGTLKMSAGAVYFVNWTPLTLSNYFMRNDEFERLPWEWRTNSFETYEQVYLNKSVHRTNILTNANVGGVMLEADKLPGQFGFKALFAKTGNVNNGFNLDPNNANNYKYMQAFRLTKNLAGLDLGLNFYDQVGYRTNSALRTDMTNKDEETIITANVGSIKKHLSVSAEFGIAKYNSVLYTDTSAIKFPYTPISRFNIESNHIRNLSMSLMGYYIGNGYLNANSGVMNGTVFGTTNTGSTALQYINSSNTIPRAVTELGQLAANRMGLVYAINPDFGKLKTSIGLGWNQETTKDSLSNFISIQHRVAALNRSRFMFYAGQYGPYANLTNVFRRSWESFYISDKSIYEKLPQFFTVDLSLKYKTKFLGKDIILTEYSNYNNVTSGTGMSAWGGTNLLSYVFNEFATYYRLDKTFTLVLQYCVEHIETDGTRLSKNKDTQGGAGTNQTGKSYGVGIDIITGARSGLYLRQKWYEHYDKNFELDKFNGYESSAELKIFF
jgi:hypothetical protein